MPAALQPEVWNARKSAFLEAYSKIGTVKHAAAAIGIPDRTVYEWLDDSDKAYDPAFARAFPLAKRGAAENALLALRRQAERAQYAWDTTAAIFLVKGEFPEYRD